MSEELWYVKLANGDVHRVTLDQLDGAFQAGHIDEGTMVLAAGASQWTKLGDLAGLDDESAPPDPQPQPYIAPAPVRAAPAAYVAPATPAAYAAPVYAAPRAAAVPSMAPAYAANSLRPMSMDLGDAADYDMPFKRKSGKGWLVAALAFLLVAG
ncbi:MAG TPA: GYF domain-containing protein, partial [Polyangiaceae bacterium]